MKLKYYFRLFIVFISVITDCSFEFEYLHAHWKIILR